MGLEAHPSAIPYEQANAYEKFFYVVDRFIRDNSESILYTYVAIIYLFLIYSLVNKKDIGNAILHCYLTTVGIVYFLILLMLPVVIHGIWNTHSGDALVRELVGTVLVFVFSPIGFGVLIAIYGGIALIPFGIIVLFIGGTENQQPAKPEPAPYQFVRNREYTKNIPLQELDICDVWKELFPGEPPESLRNRRHHPAPVVEKVVVKVVEKVVIKEKPSHYILKCPNCNAIINEGLKCEYCKTLVREA